MSEKTESAAHVDPWRFTGSFVGKLLAGGIPDVPSHDPIPWAPVDRSLAHSKVALLSTAGLSMKGDEPFDMDFERARPTRGDGGFRRLTATATAGDVDANHLHIDTSYINQDLSVALPTARLAELVASGEVGSSAKSHYSIMGFQGNDTSRLVNESAPAIAKGMSDEGVNLALLAPV